MNVLRQLVNWRVQRLLPSASNCSCYASGSGPFQRVGLGAQASLNYQPVRNAGHSKWANIKHVKTANDQARSTQIARLVGLMRSAAREGGSYDPKQNSKLAGVIQQYKDAKLPSTAMDKFLQSGKGNVPTQSCIYPIQGPGNCIMLIDIESATLLKSKQELHTVLRKNKGIVADQSVIRLFDHRGILYSSEFEGKPVSEAILDDATMHAIEAGASDVQFIPDHPEHGAVLEFLTEPSSFFKVKGALEKLKYNLVHCDLEYIPQKYVELEDAEIEAANKLYEKLTEHPDVIKITANIA